MQHLRQQFGRKQPISPGGEGWRTFAELGEAAKQKGDEQALKVKAEGVSTLLDLQAITTLQNNSTTFQEKIDDIAEEFSRKRSLIARLKKADLI